MQLMIVILAIAGLVLLYSAIKNQDPRDVVKSALRGGK